MFSLIPFNNNERGLSRYFDNWDRFFPFWNNDASQFRADIKDLGDKFVLQAELPGFDKNNIKINIANDRLTIVAERQEEIKNNDNDYIHRERRYGSIYRNFDVSGIDENNITANYNNGVLELTLPKNEEDVKENIRQIEIQ